MGIAYGVGGVRTMTKQKIALEGPINKCSDDECKNWRDRVMAELGEAWT